MRLLQTLAISACLVISALPVWAQAKFPGVPTAYSATMVMRSSTTSREVVQKIYRNGDELRTQLQMNGKPAPSYSVVLMDRHQAYMVMPQTNMCMSIPLSPQLSSATLAQEAENMVSVTDAGAGIAEGHVCDVKQVVYHQKQGLPTSAKIWLAKDLQNFPVKEVISGPHGETTTVTYKDIQLGSPDPALFAKPSNCRTMPSFGGMPLPH
jgi:outer membrane lipoprotein-sorting protein